MNLIQAFEITPHEIISLVGAGGKTTLMYSLANKLVQSGMKVVTTTTTKIFPPELSQSPLLIVENNKENAIKIILDNIVKYRHITLVSKKLPTGHLKGISTSLINKISTLNEVDYIIIEADGAARRPLKAPNTTEPVIPLNTTLLIPVIGIESIGCHLNDDTVFRASIASELLNLPLGSIVTAEAIATLITHPQGIIKGCPKDARIIPLLNKVDLNDTINNARELATYIVKQKHPQINRIILGQILKPEPVKEVVIGN